MILCCGEALIDMIPEPAVSAKSSFTPYSGGAIFNTAIALGRLSVSTAMLTGLSEDFFGEQLSSDLQAAGVDTHYIIKSDRPTTLAFVQLQDGQASYLFYDENSAGRMITSADLPKLDNNIKTLYFGGISLSCEPGANAYAELLAMEGETRFVMLDPNIRPSFIRDENRYRYRINQMISQADLVKVSDEDLHWILNGDASLEQKARQLLTMGPQLVVVTKGSEGAVGFLPGDMTVAVAAKVTDVVDTVGAGDTFNAGMLASLDSMRLLDKVAFSQVSAPQVEQALEFGASVAAVTVSRAGANPPWRHELA
jgi:fructokinase